LTTALKTELTKRNMQLNQITNRHSFCYSPFKSVNSAIHSIQKWFIVQIKCGCHQQHATLHDTSRAHITHTHTHINIYMYLGHGQQNSSSSHT